MGVQSLTDSLRNTINYTFTDEQLLKEALTHPIASSYSYTKPDELLQSYERLEFLGDSVLNMVIADILYQKFPDENEGCLTKRRAQLTCGKAVAKVGKKLHVYNFINRHIKKIFKYSDSDIENVTEALIGAIYIDGGFENAKQFITREWGEMINTGAFYDYKTELQNWAQKNKPEVPKYKMLTKIGPQNNLRFTVLATLDPFGTSCGTASSIKDAEQIAAKELLRRIEVENNTKPNNE